MSAKEDSSPAIVVGGFVNGLGLVRSLSALNRRVIVVTTQPYDMAHHSRYASEHHHVPNLGVQPELLAELLKLNRAGFSGDSVS